MLTQEYVRAHLNYNPITGIFTNITNRAPTIRSGTIAGCKHSEGYIVIKLQGKAYKAHRLVWLYVHGSWPKEQIDHINGIKDDNMISNLREATNRQNQQNQKNPKKSNRSGYLGVSYRKDCGRWRATLYYNGHNKSLGDFETPELANEAYITAKREHHEFSTI
jgi:hypothetical protein